MAKSAPPWGDKFPKHIDCLYRCPGCPPGERRSLDHRCPRGPACWRPPREGTDSNHSLTALPSYRRNWSRSTVHHSTSRSYDTGQWSVEWPRLDWRCDPISTAIPRMPLTSAMYCPRSVPKPRRHCTNVPGHGIARQAERDEWRGR